MPSSNPLPQDVHVNAPLTNIAIAYLQSVDDFVATKVFPNVPVQKQSDCFFDYQREDWFRVVAQARPLSSESAGTGYRINKDKTYFCDVQALHKDIDDRLRANADQPLNLDEDATKLTTYGSLLRREKDFVTKFFSESIWTGGEGGVDIEPATEWDAANSTPIQDIRCQITFVKEHTGFRPNTLVMSEPVWNAIEDNEDFLSRISVSQTRIVTPDLLAAILRIGKVVIAGAVQDVSLEGDSPDMQFVAGDYALLCYAAPSPSIMAPSAGYCFNWTGYTGASAASEGMRMSRFRMDNLRSDRVENEIAYDLKMVAADLGVLFKTVLSA